MKTTKLRIGVLMGGRSIEREVSFNSGRTICDHLDNALYDVIPLFQKETGELYLLPWHFIHRGKIADFVHRLAREATEIIWDDLPSLVDFVYLALHGRYGEDGSIQGILEILNIPYLGSKVIASAISMDKGLTQSIIQSHGYNTPKTLSLTAYEIKTKSQSELEQRLQQLRLAPPLVIKPSQEGSSLGITVVHHLDELIPALLYASTINPDKEQTVLVQEKVEGMEFVCIGIQDNDQLWQALPITEVCLEPGKEFYDYEQKYMPGRATKITPARCSQDEQAAIQKTCMHLFELLDFTTIGRIDGFLRKDGSIVILDTNTLPGTAPATFLFHQAAEIGMNHTMLINTLIKRELTRYGMGEPQGHRESMVNNHQNKKRIAVLLGGNTNERETSLDSGRNVCYKLSPARYTVLPLFVSNDMQLYHISERLLLQNSTKEIAMQLDSAERIPWSKLPEFCDFVFIGLHGGAGENGSVQGMLEMLNLPYNGSGILASALAMDKAKANTLLAQQGIDVPRHHLVLSATWRGMTPQSRECLCANIIEDLGLPLVVKPHDDGCSVMVTKVSSIEQLAQQIDLILSEHKQLAMIEEYISGMELTCGVLGNETITVLPPSQAIASGGILSIQEKFLPGQGENQTPAPLDSPAMALVETEMKKVYQVLGCAGYARIDCFYQSAEQSPTQQPRVVIIECNSLPGLTPATCIFHQAAEIGLKPMEFIDIIVQLGFERHKKSTLEDSSFFNNQGKNVLFVGELS